MPGPMTGDRHFMWRPGGYAIACYEGTAATLTFSGYSGGYMATSPGSPRDDEARAKRAIARARSRKALEIVPPYLIAAHAPGRPEVPRAMARRGL